MSLQILIVHNGQRISVDHATIASLDALKARIAQEIDIPANKQIVLNSTGKQVKLQFLRAEDELFVYSRDVFSSKPKDPNAQVSTVPQYDSAAHPISAAPDALANQLDLSAWQDLFKTRRNWALDLVEKARDVFEIGSTHCDATSIIERGVRVAVGNLEAHIQSLEQRHNEAQDWVAGLRSEQEANLSQVEITRTHLETLPGDTKFRSLIPVLARGDNQQALAPNPLSTRLDALFPTADVERAQHTVRKALQTLNGRASQLSSQVENVFQVAGKLFDYVERTQAKPVSELQRDAAQLLEEIEVISNKIASDCEHVARLSSGQKAISQASKMALPHTRDYLPSLKDYFAELNKLVEQSTTQRNASASRVVSSMQKVAEVESLFANADAQVKSLDFQAEDDRALDLISGIVQLPFVYGALLLEAVRRGEWAQKIRAESSTLAEDIASYREEEEKRRKRWHKTMGNIVAEEPTNTSVLNFELNVFPERGLWPEIERQQALEYIAALRELPEQAEVVEELEAGFQDLDKPTKRQAKVAKNFRNGSFHDAHAGTGSFFMRNSDELRTLREANQKLESEVKSQKSRVRKLEDLLYRQSQAGRNISTHSFQLVDGATRDVPTPDIFSPAAEHGVELSRKTSANTRRPSTGTVEEKTLAKRIISLEGDLHKQKQINEDLQSAAQGRQRGDARLQAQLEDAESTKRDLMANLDAVQREFAHERRLLEEDIDRHKSRNEEVEEELDRILGSCDNDIGVEEKLRSLESELEKTKAALAARDRDLKQHEEAREEERLTLNNISKALGGKEDNPPVSHAELVHKLDGVADRASRQLQDLSNLVAATRSGKEDLQSLLDRKENECNSNYERIQQIEGESAQLRNERDAEQATTTSLNEELNDARQQLKSLRAKFAEGETGSEVLQQRVTEQANRASTLATELAQAKSHVNSLDVELSTLQRRHNNLLTSTNSDKTTLEQRSFKVRELTNRLVTCYHELVRLVAALGLSIFEKDGALIIQRSSKAANTSSTTIDTSNSVTASSLLPSASSFDSSIDSMLSSWMHSDSLAEENQRFTELLVKLDRFNLNTFSEAVIKLRRDVEWTGKKWKMEARSYRDKYHRAQADAHEKLAFRSFKDGDLALFLPTRNQATRPWAAFNVGAPHYFLREQDSHRLKGREWLVARISKIEERIVDLSKTMNSSLKGDRGSIGDKASESNVSTEDDNPFELSDGLRWYLLDAAEEKFVAPSTPSVGKSTVASATHHAKGKTIGMKSQSAGGNDASAKLHSIESRRSSSNSKRGSISAGSTHQKDAGDETATRSPTLTERAADIANGKPASIPERSNSRASHRNAPSRSSGLGIEIKEPTATTVTADNDEGTHEHPPPSPSKGFLGIFGSPPKGWFGRGSEAAPQQRTPSPLRQSPLKQQGGASSSSSSPVKARPGVARTQSASQRASPTKQGPRQWESLLALDVNLGEGGGKK